jgi:hypothetical protein
MAKRKKDTFTGCLGCLGILIAAPFGYLLWDLVHPVVGVIIGLLVFGVAGFIGEQIDRFWEFQRLKKDEVERIRVSQLRQKARSEVVRKLSKELSETGRRQRARIPEYVLEAVFQRDRGQCVICGATDDLQFDHILHHSKGGADTVDNLRLLCRTCNQRRGNRFN